MCTRTKISYGCGHVLKVKNDCYSRDCPGSDKHYYEKVGDCRECRVHYTSASRGRESIIRYGPRINRSNTRVRTISSSADATSIKYDVSGGASPWAPLSKKEKTWESPHRKQADEAWLTEHEDRLFDLQDRLERVTLSERRSRSEQTEEPVLPREEESYYDEYVDDYDLVPATPTRKAPRLDVQYSKTHVRRARSPPNQDRQHSYDSLPDSMPSYRSSPKLRAASTFNILPPYPQSTYEYDYYHNTAHSIPTNNHHNPRSNYPGHSKSVSDPYYHRKPYAYEADFDLIVAQPPLQIAQPIPAPALYDIHDYYTPNASPSTVPYLMSDYSYHAVPRPRRYVEYRRY